MFVASMSHLFGHAIAHNINIRYQSIAVIQSVDTVYEFLPKLIQHKAFPFQEQHHKVLITYLTYAQQVHFQTFYI